MSKENELESLDLSAMAAVTGGTSSAPIGGSDNNIDVLLNQLHSITGSIDDIKHKTNGLDSTSMLMLCALAMRNNQSRNNTTVVVGGGGPCSPCGGGGWW